MTPHEMAQLCLEAIATPDMGRRGVSIALPYGFKRPRGWPRGELLCETERGRVYSMNPQKLLAWLMKNELIDFKVTRVPAVAGEGEPND